VIQKRIVFIEVHFSSKKF